MKNIKSVLNSRKNFDFGIKKKISMLIKTLKKKIDLGKIFRKNFFDHVIENFVKNFWRSRSELKFSKISP